MALLKDLLCFSDDKKKKNPLESDLAHQCLRNDPPVELYLLMTLNDYIKTHAARVQPLHVVESDVKETSFPPIGQVAPREAP